MGCQRRSAIWATVMVYPAARPCLNILVHHTATHSRDTPSPQSRLSLSVGLDDNWQACSNQSTDEWGQTFGNYHDSAGNPLVNETLFPSMEGMVQHAHELNLTADGTATTASAERRTATILSTMWVT